MKLWYKTIIQLKYLESQKNLENITKEKEELQNIIKLNINTKIETNRENINDLLELSNEELDRSSKIIAEVLLKLIKAYIKNRLFGS